MDKKRKIDYRRKHILELIAKEGQVKISQLSEILHTTPVTIRSDLTALENAGYLKRVNGGAIQTLKNHYTVDHQQSKTCSLETETAIAQATAELVPDGCTLFINAGPLSLYTAIELKQRRGLNIVTNSVAVAIELASHPTFRVILLGGDVNAQYSFSYGNNALEQLEHFKANKAILSIDGICVGAGITTYHAEEVPLCRAMMKRSNETVVIADSSKWGQESFSNISPLELGDYYVTDPGADAATADFIKGLGKQVIFSAAS